MAKQAGMGDGLYVAGYDLSGDIASIQSISGGPAPWDTTDITQSGMSRLGLARSGSLAYTAYFDKAANAAHQRLKLQAGGDDIVTYRRGSTLGNPCASCLSKQTDYAGTRNADGSLTFNLSAVSNGYGVEWGRMLTAGRRVDGSAGNGTSVDLGAASPGAFGLSMYVHLFAFTGTSVTIKIQESSDNAVGDAFADVVGATTAALTAVGAVRIQTGAINVERYLRVTTVGTFSAADFFVQATRFDTSTLF